MLIETSFRKDLPRNATRALPASPSLHSFWSRSPGNGAQLLLRFPLLLLILCCCCCLCFFFLLAVIFVVNILIKCRHRTLTLTPTATATQSRRSFELTRGRCIYRDQDRRAQPGHGLRHGLAALARTRLPFPRLSLSPSRWAAAENETHTMPQCTTNNTHTQHFARGCILYPTQKQGSRKPEAQKKTTTQKKSPESQSELDADSESDVRGRSHANSSLNFAQSQKFKTPNQTNFFGVSQVSAL